MREDATLAAQHRGSGGKRHLEAEDDARGTRMCTDEHDAGLSHRLELVLEELVLALVRANDAYGDGRSDVLGHGVIVPHDETPW